MAPNVFIKLNIEVQHAGFNFLQKPGKVQTRDSRLVKGKTNKLGTGFGHLAGSDSELKVRSMAVSWIQAICNDELVDFLPQFVQALKHETWEASPLAEFLLRRALASPRVAHYLYWLLVQTLPGQFPQNSSSESRGEDDVSLSEARYHRRLQLMLRALLAMTGESLRQRFLSQQLLVKNLYEVARSVKTTKESLRLKVLMQEMEILHHSLEDSTTCLPLSPSLEVVGVQVRTCSYFPSNTLPLKINFLSAETGIIPAIFKVGDDLQQDMLVIQMVRIMDKLWLKDGLDLKMVTFACVPTGHKRGMLEMVTNAETLRKIQVELGLTGSFKDRPIAEWLAKHNPSTFEYEKAVENFTVFYLNNFYSSITKMVEERDRTPFVLTSDMAYVINGGDKPTAKFHHFVDLCCQAFNIVRKHGNLLLNLFCLMVGSGIPGVTMESVNYVQQALSPELSNPEAAAMFARMIEGSLKSWFTQFNFFLHNLAQLRFTGDHNDGELLSFIPRTYTMQQEGRIRSVSIHGYQKRYDPEKYYVYILKVERENQPDPVYLFRLYKEFCELHQKLCIHFPLAKCYRCIIHGHRLLRNRVIHRPCCGLPLIEHVTAPSLMWLQDEVSWAGVSVQAENPEEEDEKFMRALNHRSFSPMMASRDVRESKVAAMMRVSPLPSSLDSMPAENIN
uniref:phosphatidylinositol 3-kinase n=1 Tax=Timema bartmani TaxID=61472 RepID=A0A7R9I170_9NEOP|nr:unnamed protein product [Timema bartmani]